MKIRMAPILAFFAAVCFYGGWHSMRRFYPRPEVGMSLRDVERIMGKKADGVWLKGDESLAINPALETLVWQTRTGDFVVDFEYGNILDGNARVSSMEFVPYDPSFWGQVRSWLWPA